MMVRGGIIKRVNGWGMIKVIRFGFVGVWDYRYEWLVGINKKGCGFRIDF